MPDLTTWPKGMRLIVRKERPHPGAQLRFTDLDGLRLTCFATNTQAASSPTSNCATADRPAARTASETPATPACATCPCTTPHRTGSGWRSSPSHSTSSPGCRCSH
ncbi:putative ISNCY family ISMk1-like transposase [Streptomyces avermitilis MA-4680 = NBRC 14893]|uniref:ISNCY family ISMk1-like transposase n=1 Tax=Streptomyces avermitilis (strain ATCC 31267 / DSM 46492 / JCM 5070 / NBRC 14893 / NCIMB 12804 / NRRL 8165 / MA-4680) TaxID=227882 RepID=Q82JZ7_STRAW|nr:putative ISNCY family ISMk1-like transposase [Streptomyces avermitilis MA-4680 = NBRC 14893]